MTTNYNQSFGAEMLGIVKELPGRVALTVADAPPPLRK